MFCLDKADAVNLDKGLIQTGPKKTKRFNVDMACPMNATLKPAFEALVQREKECLFLEHKEAYPKFDKVSPLREALENAKVTTEDHRFQVVGTRFARG